MVVLAGGFGTRLRPAVGDLPKPLAPVGDRPFLDLQIHHWVRQGARSFMFLLHYRADAMIAFLEGARSGLPRDVELRWSVEPAPLGTGGAVAHAVREWRLAGDFLVTNADTWLAAGIGHMLRARSPALGVVHVADSARYGSVQVAPGGKVSGFVEKSSARGGGWINAGLYRLNAALFAGGNDGAYSLETTLFPALVNEGQLQAVELPGEFIDIGVPDDYRRFCERAAMLEVDAKWS